MRGDVADRFEAVMAEIRADFQRDLPRRVDAMEAALERLGDGFEREAARLFRTAAHNLKGTALSLGDEKLAAPAAVLDAMSARWLDDGEVRAPEWDEARHLVESLRSREDARDEEP